MNLTLEMLAACLALEHADTVLLVHLYLDGFFVVAEQTCELRWKGLGLDFAPGQYMLRGSHEDRTNTFFFSGAFLELLRLPIFPERRALTWLDCDL